MGSFMSSLFTRRRGNAWVSRLRTSPHIITTPVRRHAGYTYVHASVKPGRVEYAISRQPTCITIVIGFLEHRRWLGDRHVTRMMEARR